MASYRQVIALSRGLSVLQAVSTIEDATVGKIHAETGLDKATIVRALETLISEGYVARIEDGARYEVTRKVTQLSSGFKHNRELGRVSGLVLSRYRTKLLWPMTVAVFDGDAMVIVEAIRQPRGLSVNRAPGYRFPMLVTSSGLSFLAYMPEQERRDILEHLANTPDNGGWNKRAKNPEVVETQLAKIRECGYAVSDENYYKEMHDGVLWGLSVPILGKETVYGAFGLMILSHVHPRGKDVDQYLPMLQLAAAEIASELEG